MTTDTDDGVPESIEYFETLAKQANEQLKHLHSKTLADLNVNQFELLIKDLRDGKYCETNQILSKRVEWHALNSHRLSKEVTDSLNSLGEVPPSYVCQSNMRKNDTKLKYLRAKKGVRLKLHMKEDVLESTSPKTIDSPCNTFVDRINFKPRTNEAACPPTLQRCATSNKYKFKKEINAIVNIPASNDAPESSESKRAKYRWKSKCRSSCTYTEQRRIQEHTQRIDGPSLQKSSCASVSVLSLMKQVQPKISLPPNAVCEDRRNLNQGFFEFQYPDVPTKETEPATHKQPSSAFPLSHGSVELETNDKSSSNRDVLDVNLVPPVSEDPRGNKSDDHTEVFKLITKSQTQASFDLEKFVERLSDRLKGLPSPGLLQATIKEFRTEEKSVDAVSPLSLILQNYQRMQNIKGAHEDNKTITNNSDPKTLDENNVSAPNNVSSNNTSESLDNKGNLSDSGECEPHKENFGHLVNGGKEAKRASKCTQTIRSPVVEKVDIQSQTDGALLNGGAQKELMPDEKTVTPRETIESFNVITVPESVLSSDGEDSSLPGDQSMDKSVIPVNEDESENSLNLISQSDMHNEGIATRSNQKDNYISEDSNQSQVPGEEGSATSCQADWSAIESSTPEQILSPEVLPIRNGDHPQNEASVHQNSSSSVVILDVGDSIVQASKSFSIGEVFAPSLEIGEVSASEGEIEFGASISGLEAADRIDFKFLAKNLNFNSSHNSESDYSHESKELVVKPLVKTVCTQTNNKNFVEIASDSKFPSKTVQHNFCQTDKSNEESETCEDNGMDASFSEGEILKDSSQTVLPSKEIENLMKENAILRSRLSNFSGIFCLPSQHLRK